MSKILEETKFIMKKYGISANKSLGQNFLIDDEAVENIVSSARNIQCIKKQNSLVGGGYYG